MLQILIIIQLKEALFV